jgi:hypothetical protein
MKVSAMAEAGDTSLEALLKCISHMCLSIFAICLKIDILFELKGHFMGCCLDSMDC